MRVFQVEFNKCDFDQFDVFIVRAENEDEAIERIKHRHKHSDNIDWDGGYKVEELTPEGKVGVLFERFNGG